MRNHPRLVFRLLRLATLTLLATLWPLPAFAAELRVAAASSTQDALGELARAFERRTGVRIEATFGSSARLYHQIRRGAPYDVFMSADADFPARLEDEGKGHMRRRYAKGRLVLWAPRRSPFDPAQGLEGLADARVRRVAIANPKLAPYGMAAEQALRTTQAAPRVSSKLVYGENAAQAAHFAATGGAEAGVLPLSLARSPRLSGQGRHWLVPESLHAPLVAEALVLGVAKHPQAAREFLDYCVSPAGQAILSRYGLGLAP
jgi:molybdate transport system substrate-binding protein